MVSSAKSETAPRCDHDSNDDFEASLPQDADEAASWPPESATSVVNIVTPRRTLALAAPPTASLLEVLDNVHRKLPYLFADGAVPRLTKDGEELALDATVEECCGAGDAFALALCFGP